MEKIIALSPVYTEDSNNLKKASLNSPYQLSRWALIKANPSWCSGLYTYDAEKALKVIVESCIEN